MLHSVNKHYSTVADGQQECTATNENYEECGSKCDEPRCGDSGGRTCPTVCDEGCFCSKGLNRNCVEPIACCILSTNISPSATPILAAKSHALTPTQPGYPAKKFVHLDACVMPATRGSKECASPF